MDQGPKRINIGVQGQDGRIIYFRTRQDKPVSRLLTNYCERRHLNIKTIDYVIDCERFDKEKTPAELNLEDGSLIDVLIPQNGA